MRMREEKAREVRERLARQRAEDRERYLYIAANINSLLTSLCNL